MREDRNNFLIRFFRDHVIFFFILAEFSAKDITQDLNRLLKLDTGMTSSALRKDDIIENLSMYLLFLLFPWF